MILTIFIAAAVIYLLLQIFYLRFFHPLHAYPGPFLATVSRIPYAAAYLQGRLHTYVQDLHCQYGSVVRIAPDELSFVSEDAWTDIYSHGRNFPKDSRFFNVPRSGVPHVATAETEEIHSRQRRTMSRAFSESALRDQEPILQTYVSLLISRLRDHSIANPSVPVDMTRWYNYTTFDFTAKYVLGDALACLETSNYHPWVSLIFDSIRASAYLSTAKYFPFFTALIQLATAYFYQDILERRKKNFHITASKLEQHLQSPDSSHLGLIAYLKQNTNPKSYLSPQELRANANLLMIAGSETTATQLSAVTFFLLSRPQTYNDLVQQIRSRFVTSEDITLASLANFTSLRAVLQEALRLHPPTPLGMPRVVPQAGAIICGNFVPGKTTVSVPHYSANRSQAHFVCAEQFMPERWLDDKPARFQNDRPEVMQPFSTGPRNCLGQRLAYAEGSLILAKMLWHFDLYLDQSSTSWTQQRAFMVWEKTPLMIRLTSR